MAITERTNRTKKDLFLKAYESNMGHISKACGASNIGRQTYYDWIEKDPKFKQAVENIEEGFIDLAECALRKNIKKRMQRAIEFYLCNKKKGEYSNTFKGEITGAGGGPVEIFEIIKTYEQPKQNEQPKSNQQTIDPKTD
ncbi:hypothetical protein ES695_11575 [Candidatus Atribacteria bacterium 1244-E10-H5-B2]|nr:MAG: hypothetical protein ES695_11575 [Candidatus Atribacteria bacterium 1244-E10-H5-B2]